MNDISLSEFVESSKIIVSTLKDRGSDLGEDDYTRYVYNEAISDATNFVRDLAKSNAPYRLAFESLEREMKKYLPLISEHVLK